MRKYTKEERLKLANVFRVARNKLWNGRSASIPANKDNWICNAIMLTFEPFCNEARSVIQERLSGHTFVSGFLHSKGIVDYNIEQLQEYRRLWLIELEREFSQ